MMQADTFLFCDMTITVPFKKGTVFVCHDGTTFWLRFRAVDDTIYLNIPCKGEEITEEDITDFLNDGRCWVSCCRKSVFRIRNAAASLSSLVIVSGFDTVENGVDKVMP